MYKVTANLVIRLTFFSEFHHIHFSIKMNLLGGGGGIKDYIFMEFNCPDCNQFSLPSIALLGSIIFCNNINIHEPRLEQGRKELHWLD